MLFKKSLSKADSPEKISAGIVVNWLNLKKSSVSPVKPAKSPLFRLLPARLKGELEIEENDKSRMSANSAVVMSAQLVLPLTSEMIKFLTTAVREQRSVGSAS